MQDELEEDIGGGFTTDLSGDSGLDALFGTEAPSDELGADDMGRGTEPAPTGTPAPTPGAPAAGTPAPASAPAGTPPAPAPGSQPTPAPAPAAAAAAPAPAAQQSFEDYVVQNYATITKQLEDGPFKLTAEEATAIGEASPIVSKILARSHLYTMLATAKAIQNSLPDTVGQLMQVTSRAQTMETTFFGQFKELAGVDKGQLANIGKALRTNHPNMPAEEFMPLLARTAAAMFGVQLAPQRGKAPPHAPAGNGRGGVSPHPAQRTVVQHGEGGELGALAKLLKYS